ncbi:2,3-dihydroxybenzoate decarboxylase [Pseudomonas sp. LAMO17WK12:I10]|nr:MULTISPECIES: hypothetical protein [unclassified Pseudomonas]PXX64799.1 2,3-dihydroxybenzoate decarboxylase [Pseudomonas sp. LAMO17WK12:I9]SNY38538.1 2,3-dihydroxybenzoate decarboxylase [Pseudomonas sp. LAMO17WK12:I10]
MRTPVSHYFYLTTAGHFHPKGLLDAISEIGVDRVLFSGECAEVV